MVVTEAEKVKKLESGDHGVIDREYLRERELLYCYC